jgi:hypothetical protein
VKCLDTEPRPEGEYLQLMLEFKTDNLGLSATNMAVLRAVEMALQAKEILPEIKGIIGGWGGFVRSRIFDESRVFRPQGDW